MRSLLVRLSAFALVTAIIAGSAQAALVNWNIDSSQSFVRLNIGDGNITTSGLTINVRIRNQNSNTSWTDAGGRKATVQGTISTDVDDLPGANIGTIQFIGNSGVALQDKNLRPNAATFDPNATSTINTGGSFTSTAAAPAAYGGRINGNVLVLFNLTAGFFSMTNVNYASASAPIPINSSGGSIPGNSSTFGFSNATFAIDGQNNNVVGQELDVPDVLTTFSVQDVNSAAGTITYLGGHNYKMTYNVNVPTSIGLAGVGSITGFASGTIVAFATIVPEPSTIAMLGLGMIGMVWHVVRRRRLSA